MHGVVRDPIFWGYDDTRQITKACRTFQDILEEANDSGSARMYEDSCGGGKDVGKVGNTFVENQTGHMGQIDRREDMWFAVPES